MCLNSFKSILEFLENFTDELSCYKFLEKVYWDDSPVCPHCHCTEYNRYSDYITLRCKNCDKKYNARKGTIFERSHVSLRKWFLAIYFEINGKKGISSIQLGKEIGVTQKTAWFILHRIRYALKQNVREKMTGVVEVDETYVGGKNKNRHYSKRKKGIQGRSVVDKIPVFGIIQRGGKVKSIVVPDVQAGTLSSHIYKNVKAKSYVMSDEWLAYRNLYRIYSHKFVQHGSYEYVNEDCHTNTIEGYWSILKKSIFGIHHWVSRKHIQKYCHSNDFRYNTRNMLSNNRFVLSVVRTAKPPLTYKRLVA